MDDNLIDRLSIVSHGIPDFISHNKMTSLLFVNYLVIYDRPGIIRGVVVGDFLKADDGKL